MTILMTCPGIRLILISKLSTALFLLIPLFCFSQTKWELKKNEDGIAVYTSDKNKADFKEIRVVCEINTSAAKLVKLMKNVNHHADWVYKTKTSYLVSRKNKDTLCYYSETILPWPVSNRDLVIRLTFDDDTLNKIVKIKAQGVSNILPVKSGVVRVPYSLGLWKVTTMNSNRIKIDYTYSVDPGGALPVWLVNLMSTAGPFNTFKQLKELLERN